MRKSLFALRVGLIGAIVTAVGYSATRIDGSHHVEGQYVEVRSATVFAGGCHVNAEADHQGRRALMGFHIEQGRWFDEDLSGVEIAVAVASDSNLSDGTPRRSVIFIDDSVTGSRRSAAVAWLRDVHGDSLGEVEEVASAPVVVRYEGERFSIEVEHVLNVEGASLPDLECCTMPESVWYEPLVDARDAVVGSAARCRFEGAGSIAAWTYEEQNNAFIGSLGDPVSGNPAPGDCVVSPSCCDIPARISFAAPMTGS